MTKTEVAAALGDKGEAIGSKRYESVVVEVIEYKRYSAWSSKVKQHYWLYFFNDSLERWGKPGDWQAEADAIYEIRVR